ncbi:MAG TPA: MOSC domain-containing protein [Burkholderiales bacterium]|jgi:MOSC domain-containing protein YiiM|nr:MOSC domain-containing protein [Burkholderiales bacterium]
MEGLVHSINISDGGVPKLPRTSVAVRKTGLQGDRQRDLEYHGGPNRAVSIYSLELIEKLRAEGHPIAVGTIGENLTLSGLDWAALGPGVRMEVGEVEIELTADAPPCRNIAPSFSDRVFTRVAQKAHPGWSRFYARVLKEGTLRVGDRVRVVASRD